MLTPAQAVNTAEGPTPVLFINKKRFARFVQNLERSLEAKKTIPIYGEDRSL